MRCSTAEPFGDERRVNQKDSLKLAIEMSFKTTLSPYRHLESLVRDWSTDKASVEVNGGRIPTFG